MLSFNIEMWSKIGFSDIKLVDSVDLKRYRDSIIGYSDRILKYSSEN